MYRYETHLHTSPVSKCARAGVRENLEFYKSLGYDGVFITNHFLDGNLNVDRSLSYEEQVKFYFSDYEEALALSADIGIKVFFGAELTYKGTDFLVFGLDKAWFLSHPEIMDMKKSEELDFLRSEGALVIQAHPYRDSAYIDHIRLFPRNIDGVEIINANRSDFENEMARHMAESYGLLEIAGTDNHAGAGQVKLAGVESSCPIESESDFIKLVRSRKNGIFTMVNEPAK